MAENYIEQFYTWVTGNSITAARLNGNVSNLTDGLNGGVKAINIGKILMNGTACISSTRVATFTEVSGAYLIDGFVSNLSITLSAGTFSVTGAGGTALGWWTL